MQSAVYPTTSKEMRGRGGFGGSMCLSLDCDLLTRPYCSISDIRFALPSMLYWDNGLMPLIDVHLELAGHHIH